MKVRIENFCGIRLSELDIEDGVTLLAGDNGAGKTSLLRGMAACLTRDSMPLKKTDGSPAIQKNRSLMLVNASTTATATMTDEGGSVLVKWPSNGVKVEGSPCTISPMVAGQVEWMAMPPTERRNLLSGAMDRAGIPILPTEEQLAQSIENVETLRRVWTVIQSQGWDAAAKQAASSWSEATGEWRGITSEAYGVKKAGDWLPPGWEENLSDTTKEALTQALTTCKKAVEIGISQRAVDDSKKQELMALATQEEADIPYLTKLVSDAEGRRGEIQKQLEALRATIITPPLVPSLPGKSNQNATCPSCKGGLVISSKAGVFLADKAVETTPEMLAQAQEERNRLQEENNRIHAANRAAAENIKKGEEDLNAIQKNINYLTKQRDDAKRRNHARSQAIAQLSEIAASTGSLSKDDLDSMREGEARAKRRLQAFLTKGKADHVAASAALLAKVKELLAPDGLRAKCLSVALSEINDRLSSICGMATWADVSLTADMELLYGGRPIVLCSRSEQFRCQVVIQILLAMMEEASVILLDGADILDAIGRFQLVTMLKAIKIKAVVAMTAKRDYAEAVASMFGAVWWVSGGEVAPIGKGVPS